MKSDGVTPCPCARASSAAFMPRRSTLMRSRDADAAMARGLRNADLARAKRRAKPTRQRVRHRRHRAYPALTHEPSLATGRARSPAGFGGKSSGDAPAIRSEHDLHEQQPASQRKDREHAARTNRHFGGHGAQNVNRERTQTEQERTETGEAAHSHFSGRAVKLAPLQPPGRITRKARDYEADIAALRDQGYTLDAIRQALSAAGIEVSISTVRRESLRSRRAGSEMAATRVRGVPSAPSHHAGEAPIAVVPAVLESSGPDPSGLVTSAAAASRGNGRDVAEAYMQGHITNPVYLAKGRR